MGKTMAQAHVRSTISENEAQLRFGELMKRAWVDQEQVVIENDGIPVVVVLPFAYYEQLLRELKFARFERLSREGGLEADHTDLTEEQLDQELDAIRARNHQKTYK
jgi:prevent-host-death family protein